LTPVEPDGYWDEVSARLPDETLREVVKAAIVLIPVTEVAERRDS
jgi:hypothetical protein